mmetsp:Transcript_58485/g.137789  ORF Transcript_58485/g.137789 Transcript_58485/m.137789 type:complete len:314 (+) Transcript_58485:3-944(+)
MACEDIFTQFLDQTTAGMFPLPESGRMVVIHEQQSLQQAMQTLVQNKILSAPVKTDSDELVGLVDMVQLCSVVVELLTPDIVPDIPVMQFEHHFQQLMQGAFTTRTVSSIVDRSLLACVSSDSSLREVLRLLAAGHHRVCVVNGRELINVITQSAVVKMLSAQTAHLGSLGARTVQDLGLGSAPVVTVSSSDIAAEAFKRILSRHVSAVAVVDGARLLGTISVSDIRVVCQSMQDTRLLFGPVRFLLARVHMSDTVERFPAITVSDDTTFGTTIQKLALLKIHRLWVTNKGDPTCKLVKVISLGDVLGKIVDA